MSDERNVKKCYEVIHITDITGLIPKVTCVCTTRQDYGVPEISLFPEENAEGKKVVFRDTSEDARIFGFPIKANSIIINAGL